MVPFGNLEVFSLALFRPAASVCSVPHHSLELGPFCLAPLDFKVKDLPEFFL